jgi:Fe2+ transport system protein FeoA
MRTLYDLPFDQGGVIDKINTADAVKERLHSFGLIKGVEITPIKDSPFGCPRIYRCLNTAIAIRNRTAKQIEIICKTK